MSINPKQPLDDSARPVLRVVPPLEAESRTDRRLPSSAGPSAVLRRSAESEWLEIRDTEDRVLFELDTHTGRAIVRAPSGNLSLEAPAGDIELVARGAVRCRGDRVELSTADDRTSLRLGRGLAQVTAKQLTLAAEHAHLLVTETKLVGARLAATLHDARLVAHRIERVADRLHERARTVIQRTLERHHLEAGSTRTVVREGHVVKAGHASLHATEEVTIDGDRIHLG